MAANQQWYYAKNNVQHGPVSTADLKGLVSAGKVSASDLVWTDGWPNWKPVGSVQELAASNPPKRPPLPPMLPQPFARQPSAAPQTASPQMAPSPNPLPQKSSNKLLIVAGVAGGGFLFMMVICCGILGALSSGGSHSQSRGKEVVEAKPEEVIKIAATQLFHEYESNDIAADKKYKGKILQVTGTVGDISRDILKHIYVTLKSGEFQIFSIQCFFADDFEDEAAKLQPRQYLNIRGRCDGKFGNVMLKDCIIVK